MKARQSIPATAVLVLAWATLAQAQQTAEELFQSGLYREEVQGDLESAIGIYERIVEEYPSNRTVAANALMHIGLCHEKLGSREAQRAYERLVRDYADQIEIATRARTRLAALRRPLEEADRSTIVTRQVPADGGFLDGAPAPDGRHFAYVDYSTGDVALWDLVTGESRRVTNEGSWEPPVQFAINVSVSRDGKTAAYTWQRDSIIELRVLGLDGSAPRVLCSNTDDYGYTMSWSGDGRHIAVPIYDSAAKTGSIAWVSVEDGSTRELATFPSWEWVSLSHSPDDKFVAVEYPIEQDSGRYDIFLIPTDGSGAVPLVKHPANDRLLGWLPNTDHVLFLSDRSGEQDVWAIQVAHGKVAGEPRVVKRGIGNIGTLGFRDDGSLFYYYYTLRVTTGIAPFDATGRIELQAEEPLLGSNFGGVWSPDGQQLAFIHTLTAPGGPGWLERSLWVRDISTGEERALAEHLDPDLPRWFPDGKSILIAAREKDRLREASALYRIDLATGDATPLLQFPWDPSWLGIGNAFSMGIGGVSTRDGEGLIYLHDGKLVHRDMSSGRETELYSDPGLATWLLALSPEGDEIVFAVNDSTDALRPHAMRMVFNAGRLMIVPSEGGEARELARLSGPGNVSNVAWTPDGQYVLFLQRRGDAGAALWRVSLEGGDAERVWETDRRIIWFGLSPDGSQAVYATPEVDFEVWVMENLVAVVGERQ